MLHVTMLMPYYQMVQSAHINVNDKDWWFKKILEFKKKYEELKIICICSYKLENKRMKLVPLQYDDEIINYLD